MVSCTALAMVTLLSVLCVLWFRGLPATHDLAQLCDIFTYTTMISQCNSHHQLHRAMELVAEMRSRAIPLNVHTYSALLNVCLKANELELSEDVYARMLAEGVTPNLVTYNTLLDIYNKTGRWLDALSVLELLQHQVCRMCLMQDEQGCIGRQRARQLGWVSARSLCGPSAVTARLFMP